MKFLERRVAPSAVTELIASVVLYVAPWVGTDDDDDAEMELPDERFVRGMRSELGVLGRAAAQLA